MAKKRASKPKKANAEDSTKRKKKASRTKKPTEGRKSATATRKSKSAKAAHYDHVLNEINKLGKDAALPEAQQAIVAKQQLDQMLGLARTHKGQFRRSPMAMSPFGGDNIVCTSIEKKRKGKTVQDDQLAIVVYVRSKAKGSGEIGPSQIPPTIGGLPTDVVEIGEARPRVSTCGGSVCVPKGSGLERGTIGCICTVKGRDERFILTNWHVIADRNPIQGSAVFDERGQPIGKLSHWLTPSTTEDNFVDMALAEADDSSVSISQCRALKDPLSTDELRDRLDQSFNGLPVLKVGAKTKTTRGVLKSVDAPIRFVNPENNRRYDFKEQLMIGPGDFSAEGDSGSLIITEDGHPIGLLFCGTDDFTFANRIGDVMATGKITSFRADV